MAKGKKKETTKKTTKPTKKAKAKSTPPPAGEKVEGIDSEGDAWEPESVFGGEPTTAEPKGVEETLVAQVEAYRNQLARMGADFANFRRRAEEEKSKTLLYANESLINALLPVLDDFDRGIGHMDQEGSDPSEVFDGLKLIWRRLLKTLKGNGVQPFESVGERFDPLRHDAVRIMDQEGLPGGTIIQELEKGYQYHDRLLRAAKVVVTPLNKTTPAAEHEAEEEEQPIVSDSVRAQDSPWGDAEKEGADEVKEEGEVQAEILDDDDVDEEFEVVPEEEDPAESDDEPTVSVVEIDENLLQQDFELDETSFEAGFGPDAPDASDGNGEDDDSDLDFIEEKTKPKLDVPESDN